MLLRKAGIVALHATTSINALHYIFQASGDNLTRKLAILQAAGWLAIFRQDIGNAPKLDLAALNPIGTESKSEEALADIFRTIGQSREQAAAKTLGYLEAGGANEAIFAAGRRLIFQKGRDSHDYKFAAAAWEESILASDVKSRKLLTASAMGHFPSSTAADSPLMVRAREAVAGVLGK